MQRHVSTHAADSTPGSAATRLTRALEELVSSCRRAVIRVRQIDRRRQHVAAHRIQDRWRADRSGCASAGRRRSAASGPAPLRTPPARCASGRRRRRSAAARTCLQRIVGIAAGQLPRRRKRGQQSGDQAIAAVNDSTRPSTVTSGARQGRPESAIRASTPSTRPRSRRGRRPGQAAGLRRAVAARRATGWRRARRAARSPWRGRGCGPASGWRGWRTQ